MAEDGSGVEGAAEGKLQKEGGNFRAGGCDESVVAAVGWQLGWGCVRPKMEG